MAAINGIKRARKISSFLTSDQRNKQEKPMKHIAILIGLIIATLHYQQIAYAQESSQNSIEYSQTIGVLSSTQQKLIRILDKDNNVACYMLSDGKSAPSCIVLPKK